jgi:ABC-type sugar transport system permease subunit
MNMKPITHTIDSIPVSSTIPAPRKKKWLTIDKRIALDFYLLAAPFFTTFLIIWLYPLFYGLYLSFTNFTGFNLDKMRIVGFRNYHRVFTDSDAMYALWRTILVTAINVPVGLAIGFALALILNKKMQGIEIFRVLFFFPSIIPIVATGRIWLNIYNGDGIFNHIFIFFGLNPINWLGYDHATQALIIMLLWGSGGSAVVFLAGLKGVPRELYEAAEIDGANRFRNFLNITAPLLTPVVFFNIVMGIIGSLQILLQPIMLSTGSGLLTRPLRPNYLYLIHAFQQIFTFQKFGYGLAMIWVLFILILVFTLILFRTSRYWVYYEVDTEGK